MCRLAALLTVIAAAAGFSPSGQAQPDRPAEKSPDRPAVMAEPIRLDADRNTADLAARSPAVTWGNGDYHLVQFGNVTLDMDGDDHLTATLKGGVLTFDDADCTIHLAVFDNKGALLGTASIVEHVPRAWEGVPVLMFEDWKLDFGSCACYHDVAFITGAATHAKVQTPDDWQEE